MFISRNKKIMYTPVNPSFTIEKLGLRRSMASRFTIYSINQISDLIYQISYIIYKISDIL